VDTDNNGAVSSGDIEYISSDFIDVPAGHSLQLLVSHTPDFSNGYEAPDQRYGRRCAQGSLSLVEENRMRSSAFAIRTWELAANETVDKETWFFTTAYREEADYEWLLYQHYNLERDPDTNINLISHYSDYRRTMSEFLDN
jgi:hypothetical protein